MLSGQVFPAIKINLHSNKLEFMLNDEVAHKQTKVTQTGQTFPVAVDPSAGNDSHVSFGNPVYNLGFTLTPGIDARLSVDVAVWSDSWDWPIWFPQLAIDLPPGGMDFGCHQNTACVLDFEPKRETASTTSGIDLLKTLGCNKQANKIVCTGPLAGYTTCLDLVGKNQIIGVESCDGTAILNGPDKDLTKIGCGRQNDKIGYYICPGTAIQHCVDLVNGGKVISCQLWNGCNVFDIPLSPSIALQKLGCKATGKEESACKNSAWICPKRCNGNM